MGSIELGPMYIISLNFLNLLLMSSFGFLGLGVLSTVASFLVLYLSWDPEVILSFEVKKRSLVDHFRCQGAVHFKSGNGCGSLSFAVRLQSDLRYDSLPG